MLQSSVVDELTTKSDFVLVRANPLGVPSQCLKNKRIGNWTVTCEILQLCQLQIKM